jgi:UDP-2-acetamido-2,6-beta-L-arabino-hexul-4-ose reductase
VKKILVTGGRGFLGRNLANELRERGDSQVTIIDREESIEDLNKALLEADVVFHLAGVNRPQNPAEFESGNAGLTETICQFLRRNHRSPKVVFSSSIQADLDNPYGASKARAERALEDFAHETGACVRIYRLKNIFGKWCRPNYNSVTATFCHNIAHGLPITIADPDHEVELSYVDDIIAAFSAEIDTEATEGATGTEIPAYRIRLGDLAGRIQAFDEMRATATLPDFAEGFNRALYATYLSYVPVADLEYNLKINSDTRGSLAEFVKQKGFGQVFVSRTRPGVTRGNHYHHTKTEKFLVVGGDGLIRLRAIESDAIEEYAVTGSAYQVIDIPPGCTHSITNIGKDEMVTLFWSSEIFDPNHPDTYYLAVDPETQRQPMLLERS